MEEKDDFPPFEKNLSSLGANEVTFKFNPSKGKFLREKEELFTEGPCKSLIPHFNVKRGLS